MHEPTKYDVAIIGGGLAGLSVSILLRKKGYAVALFEKEHYPFHKVCGEYISFESWDHLCLLGLPLQHMELPVINKLLVSSPSGNVLRQSLPLGGFGISRYFLDNELKQLAVKAGVVLYEGCKVDAVYFDNNQFRLTTMTGEFVSDICCGSFGKRSNLDHKLNRNFLAKKTGKLNNYIGVKYHIEANFPGDTIALHNFENGYCGISKIEHQKYCLCYLTTADNLKRNQNAIKELEKNVLFKNEHLKKIFTESTFLYKQPVTISQISFSKKSQVEDHILLLGDAAGMISPLCGNGMSMALHSSKIAVDYISEFLDKQITRDQMEKGYAAKWQSLFSIRLKTGRIIQRTFGKKILTNVFVSCMKQLPFITRWLIKKTHGSSF